MDKSVFHMNSKGLFSEFLSLALMTLEPARPPPAPLLLPLTAIPGHPVDLMVGEIHCISRGIIAQPRPPGGCGGIWRANNRRGGNYINYIFDFE